MGWMRAFAGRRSAPDHDYIFAGRSPAAFRGTTLRSDRESSKKPKSAAAHPTKTDSKNKEMGYALRSVYQKTVDEAVPDEMLDLLGKLG